MLQTLRVSTVAYRHIRIVAIKYRNFNIIINSGINIRK